VPTPQQLAKIINNNHGVIMKKIMMILVAIIMVTSLMAGFQQPDPQANFLCSDRIKKCNCCRQLFQSDVLCSNFWT